ncbi:acyl-CoA mutase large subunit family protein [Congregibacter variabilis]|uniref:Acyl-CoA mutase large subunit family protein n=1 Tax=Congregibacter variabilis TaxID=3081200 RepID=A0ABZ0I402_9GAMM|nr:acyl-CoA mutase large subunit family protein [Congregibacter sp. IMCC43200]
MQQPPDDSGDWVSASGIPLKSYYMAEDIPSGHQKVLNAAPGEAPFHRGSYPTGYRTKPWRIFQLSGFGKPEDENERIQFLLEQGETGFIMEHDRNTADHLYNVDHPEVLARREDVGLTGAVMQSVRDIDICMKDLPIETSYGHAGGAVVQHAPFALAGYWTVAKQRGFDLSRLPGTGQSDFFLTYLGCVTKQQIPTDAGLRFNADIMEFCDQHLPRWVPVSIAGYNGADSGLNAPQELGALFANAVEYLEEIKRRGTMPIARAARACGGVSFRMSMDIFEEASKLRAARLMWTQLLSERYDVHDPKVSNLRIHCVTAGSRMTYQQPINNIVRGTLMGLAAALGGVQSLGVSGYDEALSIPSEHAHQMSVRIQQVLQEETNIAAVTDPLGGSYYIETLTAQLIERAWAFFDEIQEQGGFLAALDSGWMHQKATENQHKEFMAQSDGTQKIIGVTDHTDDISPFEVDGFMGVDDAFDVALARLEEVKRTRHEKAAGSAMRELETVLRSDRNIMPAMMTALECEVTLGEVGDIYRDAFGDWATPIQT